MFSLPVPVKDGIPAAGDFVVFAAEGRAWSGRCDSVKVGGDGCFQVKTTTGGKFSCVRLELGKASSGVYKGVLCKCLAFDRVPKKLALCRSLERLLERGQLVIEDEGLRVSMRFLLGREGYELYQEALDDDMEWAVICDEIDSAARAK